VRWCTFHPAYGYEDFIEGYRPRLNAAGQLIFDCCDGIFKTLSEDASHAPEQKFFLIVDEINRGDIPRIFGELLTLLEGDKRGLKVSLPLSGDRFAVPPNVHLIGTMGLARVVVARERRLMAPMPFYVKILLQDDDAPINMVSMRNDDDLVETRALPDPSMVFEVFDYSLRAYVFNGRSVVGKQTHIIFGIFDGVSNFELRIERNSVQAFEFGGDFT
jgi:hypothetical protein